MKSLCRAIIFLPALLAAPLAAQTEVVWKLASPAFAAPVRPIVYGAPTVDLTGTPPSTTFNGRDDGYALAINPVAGWPKFTITARFRPDASGPEEQRFLHIEDAAGHRITMETRLAPDGTWTLDTFLKNPGHQQHTLHSAALTHPSGEWHVATLHYDGKIMSSTVDGKPELSAPIEFPATGPGSTGVGVRLNKVSWFKGAIAEFRFSPF